MLGSKKKREWSRMTHSSSSIPLNIVIENKNIYREYFDDELTLRQIAGEAVRKTQSNFMMASDWRITNKKGIELPQSKKLKDVHLPARDTIYVSLINEPDFRKNYPQDKITKRL